MTSRLLPVALFLVGLTSSLLVPSSARTDEPPPVEVEAPPAPVKARKPARPAREASPPEKPPVEPEEVRPAPPKPAAPEPTGSDDEDLSPLEAPAGPRADGLELTPASPRERADRGVIQARADQGVISIRARTRAQKVRWLLLPEGVEASVTPSTHTLIVTLPREQAQIVVYAVGVVDGQPTGVARMVIEVPAPPGRPPGGPPGGASTEPPPQRPQAPAPAAVAPGALTVIVVDDARVRAQHPYMAAIWRSQPLRESVEKAGHVLKLLDVSRDAGVIQNNRLGAHMQRAGGPPCLLLMDSKGRVHHPQPCPRTANEVVGEVNKLLTGK